MQSERLRYSAYAHLIDIDAFEAEIGFEVLREGVNKKGEAEDIGHCPDPWNMHKNGDTTGKFAINRDEHIWGCFVCGGGNLLALAMAVKELDEQAAQEWLVGLTRPREQSDDEFISEIEMILQEEKIDNPPLPWFNERVLDRWTQNVGQLDHWLAERGISDEVAHTYKLGFDPRAERGAEAAAKRAEGPYRGPAVYLPHFWNERLVGWQQRWLDEDRPKWIPKYTNTGDFPKTETIFNYNRVYLAERPIIVCESVATVLFLTTLGYPAVAVFGGAVSEEQMRLLRQFQQGVVLAPDNDDPGRKWLGYTEAELSLSRRRPTRTPLAQYLERFINVQVIEPVGELDSGNDLADLLDEGLPFAAGAVKVLYAEAQYY